MSLFGDIAPGLRRSVLAVGMLVILLAMTGAAWLIARQRGGPYEGEQWYLVLDGADRTIGWAVVARVSDQSGARGYDIRGSQGVQDDGIALVQWSHWRLNAAGTQGRYSSHVPLGLGPGGEPVRQVTTIDYAAGAHKVIVTQSNTVTPAAVQAALDVGEDYLPEGTLWPTVVAVARAGQPERRRMVIDQHLALFTILLEPQPAQPLTVNGAVVTVTPVVVTQLDENDQPADESRYHVGPDGTILRVEILGDHGRAVQILQHVDFARILERYPLAPGERARTLRESRGM